MKCSVCGKGLQDFAKDPISNTKILFYTTLITNGESIKPFHVCTLCVKKFTGGESGNK